MKRFLSLLFLLPVCLTASAATISFSSITSTNAVKGADQLLVNSALGGTNYATRTATVGTLQTAVVTGSSVTNALGYQPQPASANLTNWSGIAATTAGVQATLGQVYQATNSTLTTLAGTTTVGTGQIVLSSVTDNKQPLAATLTALSTNTTTGTGTIVLSSVTDGKQAASANLTTLATLNGGSLTNIAASNIVSGGQLVMGSVSSDSAVSGGIYYVKPGGASRGIASGVLVSSVTNLVVSGNVTATNGVVTFGLTNSGVTVHTPSAVQTVSAGTTVSVDASTMRVAGSGGAVTLTSTPSIATNNIADGTIITIRGTSDSNTVTLQDYRTLSGSCLAMEVPTITLLNGSESRFQWSVANQRWQAAAPISANSSQNHPFNIVTAQKAYQSFQGSLTHAGTVTLDFDAISTVNSVTLTGNVTLATSNLATNRTYRLLIKNTQSTNCTPTWPGDWRFLGGRPTTLTASRWGMLSLESWGSSDTNVVAAYAEEQ